MLVNLSRLIGQSVLSLHMGGPIARATVEVVDPEKLKIAAFYVDGAVVRNDPEVGNILETDDIREYSELGMIVDSEERFVNQGDVMKLDKVLELNFTPIGLKVKTKKGTKLGKIVDCTVDTISFKIQQLIVKRPLTKALIDPELVIPRSEILEINDDEIIVKDEEEKIRKKALKEDFIPNFVNPFREPGFSANRAVREDKNERES